MSNNENSKPVWQSKTVWVNACVLIIALGMFLIQAINEGQIVGEYTDELLNATVLVVGVVNIILRFVTNQPLDIPKNNGKT